LLKVSSATPGGLLAEVCDLRWLVIKMWIDSSENGKILSAMGGDECNYCSSLATLRVLRGAGPQRPRIFLGFDTYAHEMIIVKTMMAILHSDGQQRTKKDGDTEKRRQKPALQQKTTDDNDDDDEDRRHTV